MKKLRRKGIAMVVAMAMVLTMLPALVMASNGSSVFCQFYAQNQGGNWEWMGTSSESLVLNEPTKQAFRAVDANGTSLFALATEEASFGFQFGDGGLSVGDQSDVSIDIEPITIKATGYEDLVIELTPSQITSHYLAKEVAWGIDGNATMLSLKDYLGEDFLNYLKAITSIETTVTLRSYTFTPKPAEVPEFDEDYVPPTTMRGLTASEIVGEMQVGWNLGNTLDSLGGETAWGNPKTTKKMIDEIKKAGFNTLRIPITWDDHLGEGPDFIIKEDYLKRVETIVNYGLANDMYTIINIHHSYGWNEANKENEGAAKAQMTKIWEQVADHFKAYGDQLIFETLNEPRDGNDWIGYQEAYEVINAFNAACLDTIRTSGGNNGERIVMIPGYAAAANEASILALEVPEDEYVAVSVHAYMPYSLALDTSEGSQTTWNSAGEKRILENTFKFLKETLIDKGIPVVIGEFGSVNKQNLEARMSHAKDYVSVAKQYSMPCIWWDNGVAETEIGEALGLFDRVTLTWTYPEIVDALFEGYANPNEGESNPLLLFKGKAVSNGSWGQALKFSPGSDVILSDLIPNSRIAVSYASDNLPEMILQSWSGGPGWLKIAPSEVKEDIAYFDYEDLVAAYGEGFLHLNQIYIGDTGAYLEITKVEILHSPVAGEFLIYGEWQDGLNGQVTLTNVGEEVISDWKISIVYEGEISNLWNGVIESHEGNYYVIKNDIWNKEIPPGRGVTIGWTASGEKADTPPIKYLLK